MKSSSGIAEAAPAAQDDLAWLKRFELEHGRPLRVLHVGNIANNAYLNASFLRRVGIDCHVFCYDYYDPMATPEWEVPRGVEGARDRPQWFVQGPSKVGLAYLHALLDDRVWTRRLHWWRLSLLKHLLLDPRTRVVGIGVKRVARKGMGGARRTRHGLAYAASWTSSLVRWAGRRSARTLGFDVPEPPLVPRVSDTAIALRNRGVRPESLPAHDEVRYELQRLELIDRFREVFPQRPDSLSSADFIWFGNTRAWAELFHRYDVVQCYATDPIVALLTAVRPYVAYEHGTLRDFTLGDNPIHRLNALAYREANHVFVTNGDCLAYAERLGIERYSPMIHPVDVDQHERVYTADVDAIRRHVGTDVVLLCPLRHDWAIKGTDVHIRALPAIVASTEQTVKLLLCEWGAEVDASRRLIDELGVGAHVEWLAPLDRHGLITHLQAADVLLDQIALPHFGATAPQGLAAGVPVVMSYKPESTMWIVAEPAPILSAFDPDGVARAVETALDPEWRREFGERARSWVHRHHHQDRLVLEHCRVYRRLIKERDD